MGSIAIRNEGERDLHISRLEASCGCAGLDLARNTVPPGGQVRLGVSARIRVEAKKQQFAIHIWTNDPATPEAVHLVKAEGIPPVLRTDPAELQFGDVLLGSCPLRQLKVLRADGAAWPTDEPLVVRPQRGLVHFEVGQGNANPSPRGLVITVALPRELQAGGFTDALTIRPVGSARAAEVIIRANIVPPILVVPNVLYFDEAATRSGVTNRHLVAKRTDGKALGRIVKVKTPMGVQVREEAPTSASEGGSARRLVVSLRPSLCDGDLKGAKLLVWLEGETEPLAVRVMASFGKGGHKMKN